MSGIFIVEEIPKKTAGNRPQSGVKFQWTAANFSAPRGPWEYGVSLRTVRTDYPGSDTPTEQVLGSNFDEFEMSGVWDNKYNGGVSGTFAEDTRVAFEDMVRRGNLCRIQFEGIAVYGLITKFKARYFTSFKVGYSFSVSPHYRNPNGDVRTDVKLAPTPTDNPDSYQQKIDDIIQQAKAALDAAPAVYAVGTVYQDVAANIATLQERSDTLGSVVANRVFTINDALDPTNQANSSLSRMVQGLQSIRDTSAALIPLTADATADTTGLSIQSAEPVMSYEDWIRSTRTFARQLILLADQAAKDISSSVAPDAQALYRPLAGESLYGISTRFYGVPDRWREIYDRNSLISFDLTGLELLVIPERGQGA